MAKFVDLAACGDHDGVKASLASASLSADEVNALDSDGRSAFHLACLNDDVKLLNFLLSDERTNLELCTSKGDTGLHMAALYASLGCLGVLLADSRTKALVAAQNKYGETPLHLCAGSGDKSASRAVKTLLEGGASLLAVDQWRRGPMDVAYVNAENVGVFKSWLAEQSDALKAAVAEVTAGYYKNECDRPAVDVRAVQARAKMVMSGLSGAKAGLKKVGAQDKKVSHMFTDSEGKVAEKGAVGGAGSAPKKRALSKLVEYPGDLEEVKRHAADASIDVGGKDSFGMTALHKFASWRKSDLMDVIIPLLSPEQLNAQDPSGKTALHWAIEMNAVTSIAHLAKTPGIDTSLKDKDGKTPLDMVEGAPEDNPVAKAVREALS